EKYFDSQLDPLPTTASWINGMSYRVFHTADQALIQFSLKHFADFFWGMRQLPLLFDQHPIPEQIKTLLELIQVLLNRPVIDQWMKRPKDKAYTWKETVYYGKFLLQDFKSETRQLIQLYARFDAWHSMAVACTELQLHFPEIVSSPAPLLQAKGLYHLLLEHPVAYDLDMDPTSNFVFLTGANMAGKSTFIKAVGCAVYLAHLGMGVPARAMTLSVFDGLLSNINVADNLAKGESYFFNEVQRIKNTLLRISDGKNWLVLIDEIFKGTNIEDAMKCSTAVIRGLLKIRNSLFILSTHLYEIAQEVKAYPNISFRYFSTTMEGEKLVFNYELKEGVSQDRLGYLILKQEKVIELLDQL
ncbi:MAG: MutS-related protein, partial [Chitinophagaceae bacterium]